MRRLIERIEVILERGRGPMARVTVLVVALALGISALAQEDLVIHPSSQAMGAFIVVAVMVVAGHSVVKFLRRSK